MPDISNSGFDFLKTELHTGLTLASIAAETGDGEKSERNRKNARRAYDVVQRTKERVLLTPEQAQEVSLMLNKLRRALEKLGETFQE